LPPSDWTGSLMQSGYAAIRFERRLSGKRKNLSRLRKTCFHANACLRTIVSGAPCLPDPMTTRPLAGFSLFESSDLDEARERVARVFCPHRLDMIGRGTFDACHNHVAGERLSLNYIQYGAKTLIAPGELKDFYLLQIPISGGAAISNGPDHY